MIFTPICIQKKQNAMSQDFFLNKFNVRLSDEDRNELDKDLSIQEISKSMSSLLNRNSQGSDSLTKEFYDYFCLI